MIPVFSRSPQLGVTSSAVLDSTSTLGFVSGSAVEAGMRQWGIHPPQALLKFSRGSARQSYRHDFARSKLGPLVSGELFGRLEFAGRLNFMAF